METWGLQQETACGTRLLAFLPGAVPAAPVDHRVVGHPDAMSPFLKGNGVQHRLACLFSCSLWKEQHACPHGCERAVPAGCC